MDLNDFNGHVKITVAGEEVEVNAGDPVKETLKSILQGKGIDSFTILVDGNEVVDTCASPHPLDSFQGNIS